MTSTNTYIDHTQLKATSTLDDIAILCKEAMEHNLYAVCVNGYYTAFAKAQLKNTSIKIATVVGFPLGAASTESKVFETKDAISHGADEIDMVLQIGALINNDLETVKKDILAVREASKGKVLKVIFENCYLTDSQIKNACEICLEVKVDFIKTSTGFGTGGATIENVRLMKNIVGNQIKIKASGGIRDKETALKYIALGVDRIGTSSGIKIVEA
ncbi:deoxyribose-phosphate aldolase [Nonlabens ulvanivorans]|nr:deoxyribose-phosphate aldolase [Nonlabens ulvanivorans]GAK94713.1 deoxyribose-phosphate aldolase [Nonlabens ulvanivorans]